MIKLFKTILLSASLLCVGSVYAQQNSNNGSNSPYSRYGFGLMNDRAQGFNKGMAGLGLGMRHNEQVNYKNPASYSAIDSLTFLFDIGASLQYAHFESGNSSKNLNNSTVDYITAAFRLAPRLGMTLGLVPYSTIGYKMTTTSSIAQPTGEIKQTETYKGDGGLQQVFAGIGYEPIRNLSVGANFGYVWGSLNHSVGASFNNNNISSRQRKYDADIRTYKVDLGVQYEQRVNRNNTLIIGATYGIGHNVNRTANYYDQRVTSGQGTIGDTLRLSNAFEMPHCFAVGAVWNHRDRLRVGFDYSLELWDGCKAPQFINNQYTVSTSAYQDKHQFIVGAEYVKNPYGLRFRDRIRYRFGASYTSPYIKVNGQDGPTSYTASLGIGIPILNYWSRNSVLNISAQYERVEPSATLMAENYLRLCIGITFNEAWFSKWKVK